MATFFALIELLCIATAITLAWKVINWAWLKPKRLERFLREQGFSGNSYKLFSGDLKEDSIMLEQATSKPIGLTDDIIPRVQPFQKQCIEKYGRKSFMWIGPRPSVHIMNPEDVKDILSEHDSFPKIETNSLGRYFSRGLVIQSGKKWAYHRKIVNPAFHIEKLKQMLPAFCQSCSEMINEWQKLIPKENSRELDVWPCLATMTGDVISRTAFGSSYQEGRKIFELQKEQAHIFMRNKQPFYIPGWRFLPTKTNKKMKELAREIEDTLRGIIKKREETMRGGKATNNDLLGILLESNLNESQQNGASVGMTIDDVIEECKLFYFAGQETTANLLVWTMILLSKHQQWQAAAREEVLQVFGSEKLDFDQLSRLKIVTMILYEVLRLYPPVIALFRTIHKETRVGETLLPPGVQLYMPITFVHRDKETWGDDAGEFKPDRFSEGIAKASKGQVSFFPFGWGPRICLGQNFSLVEAKIALAMILQHFSFELSPSYAHAPVQVLTLQPQYGAHIILRRI